jgi:YtkA-like
MARAKRLHLGVLVVAVATLAGIAAMGAAARDSPSRGPVAVDVTTTNHGHLTVAIDASVTVDGEPVTHGEVVAYADMTDMPLAHTQGPLPMRELASEPGRYATETMLPMPGEYEFRIAVLGPVRGEQRGTMFVGVVE